MGTARRRGVGRIGSTLVVWLALSGALHAGIETGDGEIGFDFGLTEFDDDVGVDTAGRFALRGGYLFTHHFELEGQYSSATHDDIIDVTLRTLFVNAIVNFRTGKEVVPYVLAGAGFAKLEFDPFGIDDTDTAWQVAGGSRFFFGQRKRVAVRAELGMISESTFDEGSRHWQLVTGFTWALGSGH